MKQFVITMRVLKEYPDMETVCAAVESMNGNWTDCIDLTVEEMSAELAEEIIVDHAGFDEIGGTGIEREQTGKVFDFAACKKWEKH